MTYEVYSSQGLDDYLLDDRIPVSSMSKCGDTTNSLVNDSLCYCNCHANSSVDVESEGVSKSLQGEVLERAKARKAVFDSASYELGTDGESMRATFPTKDLEVRVEDYYVTVTATLVPVTTSHGSCTIGVTGDCSESGRPKCSSLSNISVNVVKANYEDYKTDAKNGTRQSSHQTTVSGSSGWSSATCDFYINKLEVNVPTSPSSWKTRGIDGGDWTTCDASNANTDLCKRHENI
ncbi:hypothetical protein [Photobacterium leiognathi]|uniref:hypothetical protein n=1 Tax=Photobacterium leiognathi TaxID=553611 RepID=UPI00298205E3|nr:hypothetical protein [Photobacterium leiognathi]